MCLYTIIKPVRQVRYASAWSVLPKGAGQDSQAARCFVSGHLSKCGASGPNAAEPPGSAQGVEMGGKVGSTCQKICFRSRPCEFLFDGPRVYQRVKGFSTLERLLVLGRELSRTQQRKTLSTGNWS